MKNEVRFLAREGLRSRKKDSMVLFLVLMLSFSLCICTVLTVAGMNNSLTQNLYDIFGEWKVFLKEVREEDIPTLKEDARYTEAGSSEVIAKVTQETSNDQVGNIGKVDHDLIRLGRLECLEGEFPEKPGEVAIETTVLDYLGYSYELGQDITLRLVQFKGEMKKVIDERQETYTLCGIIKPYTRMWDCGGADLVNVMVAEDESIEMKEESIFQMFLSGEGEINEMRDQLDPDKTLAFVGNYEAYNTKRFFSYPFYLTIAAIVTIMSSALVFSSQIQRRVQRLCLLRSIGSTREQALKMILWESLYLMLPAALAGGALGAGMAMGILTFLFYGDSSLVYMEFPMLMLVNSILIWVGSVYIGMFWPVYQAFKMPLTGDLSGSERKRAGKNKVKRVIELVLPAILFLSVIYCFNESYGEYLQIKEIRRWPTYAISNNFTMPEDEAEVNQVIADMEKDFYAVTGIEKVFVQKYLHGAIGFDGIESSEVVQNLNKSYDIYGETGFGAMYRDGKMDTLIRAVNDSTIDDYLDFVEGHTADREAFLKGEEVIVVLPDYIIGENNAVLEVGIDDMYRSLPEEDSRIEEFAQSAYKSMALASSKNARRENILQPGDMIDLYEATGYEEQEDGSYEQLVSNTAKSVKVGGVIRDLKSGKYNNVDGAIVPWYGVFVSQAYMEKYLVTNNQELYNNVNFAIYADWTADYLGTDKLVNNIVQDWGFQMWNDHQEYLDRYQLLISSILMRCFACIIIVMFTIVVLYQVSIASIRRQQSSIGILQALGMSRRQLLRRQMRSGILKAAAALLVAAAAYIALAAWKQKNAIYVLAQLKLVYNNNTWFIHGGLCIIVLVVILSCMYLPVRKIIRRPVIDNIKFMNE